MILIEWILNAFFLIFLLSIPAGIVLCIIEFIIEIKCFDLFMQYRFFGGSCWGMKGCDNNDCHLRHFCPIYQNAITPETAAELVSMTEERHRESELESEQ